MTDDRLDATIRSIVNGSGEAFGAPPLAPTVLTRVRAARAQDRTWFGRRVRDARIAAFPDGVRNTPRSHTRLAVAATLVVGATVIGALAVGSRQSTPAPDRPPLPAVVPSASDMTVEPSAPTPATPTPTASTPGPSGLLVLSSNGRLVVVRGDGSNRRQLSNGSVADFFPVWSPDGARIAFFSQDCTPSETCPDKGATSDLVVIDADGSNRRVLRSGLDNAGSARWAPDGNALAVNTYGSTNKTIEVSLGGGLRPVEPEGIDPAWISPDGSHILELGGDLGDSEILVQDTPTGRSTVLVTTDPNRSRLSIIGWMPDGGSVLYNVVGRSILHPLTMWIVASDGANPRPWNAYPEHSRSFGWSADRAWMLIERHEGDTLRDVVARGDGTAPRVIDGVEDLEWSRDRTVLVGTAGALTDLYHVGGRVFLIDPSGTVPPVEIQTPGLLGLDWRSAR